MKVLAVPALGAHFVQMLIDLSGGSNLRLNPQADIENFYFVISGRGGVREGGSQLICWSRADSDCFRRGRTFNSPRMIRSGC